MLWILTVSVQRSQKQKEGHFFSFFPWDMQQKSDMLFIIIVLTEVY